jgi:hypothetical protein
MIFSSVESRVQKVRVEGRGLFLRIFVTFCSQKSIVSREEAR